MRYITHEFAHAETLERARRWLIQVGIDPIRIEARTHRIINLAVAVEGGESAEVQCVFDVVESSDPDGNPGFWDLASRRHVVRRVDTATSTVGAMPHSHSFVVGWHPQDTDCKGTQTDMSVERLKHYQEERD